MTISNIKAAKEGANQMDNEQIPIIDLISFARSKSTGFSR
jgi:hypothetical protein